MDGIEGNKRIIKSGEEEEDRISSLPDFLIQHILSFLPATDLVKTSVLSKWWNNQWTHVPVLKFVPNVRKYPNFIDRTLILHDCSNLHKFQIKVRYYDYFPNLNAWIRFAFRKHVKELILDFDDDEQEDSGYFSLPKFVFNNSSLLKLKLCGFSFKPSVKVHWESVKSLRLYSCSVGIKAIENALSGCPVLEYLELRDCDSPMFSEHVIASKSLKTLILDGVKGGFNVIEISCPNLERLRVSGGMHLRSLKLMNLRSSVYATLDFYFEEEHSDEEMEMEESDLEQFDDDLRYEMEQFDCRVLAQQTLRQVEHVEKLEIGRWLMDGDLTWKDQPKNAFSNEVR